MLLPHLMLANSSSSMPLLSKESLNSALPLKTWLLSQRCKQLKWIHSRLNWQVSARSSNLFMYKNSWCWFKSFKYQRQIIGQASYPTLPSVLVRMQHPHSNLPPISANVSSIPSNHSYLKAKMKKIHKVLSSNWSITLRMFVTRPSSAYLE